MQINPHMCHNIQFMVFGLNYVKKIQKKNNFISF